MGLEEDHDADDDQQGQQQGGLGGADRLAQADQMASGQGDAEGADDGDAEGVAEPPGLEGVEGVGAVDQIQAGGRQGRGRKRRDHGGAEQEAAGAVDRREIERRGEPARQQHGPDDLDHVGDGEQGGQGVGIARQQLSRGDAGGQQAAETEVVQRPAGVPEPDRDRHAAGGPETGDKTGGPGELDGQHDQHQHRHGGEDRGQRLAEKGHGAVGRDRRGDARGRGGLGGRCRSGRVERAAHGHAGSGNTASCSGFPSPLLPNIP